MKLPLRLMQAVSLVEAGHVHLPHGVGPCYWCQGFGGDVPSHDVENISSRFCNTNETPNRKGVNRDFSGRCGSRIHLVRERSNCQDFARRSDPDVLDPEAKPEVHYCRHWERRGGQRGSADKDG